ncbi:MAG: VWA domain-containing protein [Sandaracinaceae bacterium]|nr:VWA domain-containing protein [Sandaracinaceae bacterium]
MRPSSRRLARLGGLASLVVALALASLLGACAGQSASYTRFRRAADTGRVIASREVRVADFVNRFAQDDASPAVLDSATASALYVDARLANPHLPREGATALLGVTVRGLPRTVRASADLVIVVDVSGSMNEAGKITAVRHALARMLESLDPADRVSIVTFSDEAHEALPMTSVASARPVILEAIERLYADGGTNIEAGLSKAVELARRARSTDTRVVFLSDGMATVGRTSHEEILRAVAPLSGMHVPLTTIGVGDAIDFELLEDLARDHGGAFHFVDQPAEVERVFATYVRSLNEISAREVELRVTAPAGGRIVRVFDERARLEEGGRGARLSVGDLGASDAYVALYELEVPAGFAPSAVPIEIRFRTIDGVEEETVSQGAPFGYDGTGVYELVDAREPGLCRAATMGYAAIGLLEAARADERGDASSAEQWLRATLVSVQAAQRRLALTDPARAASLDEPVALLRRSHEAVAARLPARNDALAEAAPPVLVLAPSAQVITPLPGLSAVPSTEAVASPDGVNVVVVGAAPSSPSATSARFSGWR